MLFPLCRESCLAWTLPIALQPVLSSSLPSEIILNSHCLLQVPHSHHPARPQQVALPASSSAENIDAGMALLLQRRPICRPVCGGSHLHFFSSGLRGEAAFPSVPLTPLLTLSFQHQLQDLTLFTVFSFSLETCSNFFHTKKISS